MPILASAKKRARGAGANDRQQSRRIAKGRGARGLRLGRPQRRFLAIEI